MTDRELLELAAKAAGIKTSLHKETDSLWIDGPRVWNPLTDDGDALRLAVKLGFLIEAAKQGLYALEMGLTETFHARQENAITTLRSAIAKAEWRA